MNIQENLKDYKSYDLMTEAEKAQVDMLVEQYKRGALNTDYTGITHNDVEKFINNRLDLEHLNKINEKLNETQASANAEANKMRYRLFEERWKNGFYTDGKHMPVPGKEDDGEVKALKEEVKSLKGDINELKQLLIDKLK